VGAFAKPCDTNSHGFLKSIYCTSWLSSPPSGGAPREVEDLARGCVQSSGAAGVAEGVVRSGLVWAEHFAFLGGFPRFIVLVGGELNFPSFAFDDLVQAIGR
jgi:hypothetical protein